MNDAGNVTNVRTNDLRAELEGLLGAAGVAALQAWLEANGLSIVRLPQ